MKRNIHPIQNGKGYATEAALAVQDYALNDLALEEIVSFTTRQNKASRRVMEKIGMTRNKDDDFDHPNLPDNHPLGPHVLYRAASSKV